MAELENSGKIRRHVTIEEFFDLIDSGGELNLSYDKLNEIIAVHGFQKFHKGPKTVLVDAVRKLELMDLTRSTKLDDGVSPLAYISLTEALKGLKDLDWQECHVNSVVTLDALVPDTSAERGAVPAKRKRPAKRARKLIKVKDLVSREEAASSSTTGSAEGTNSENNETLASLFSREMRKSVPRKKRSPRVEFRGGREGSGAHGGDVSPASP